MRAPLLAACCFAVFYFTLRFGLRGFVFADAFHSPLIVVGTLALLVGAILLLVRSESDIPAMGTLVTPLLPKRDLWLFLAHVSVLNGFLVLLTEPHWLRLWIFRRTIVELQPVSTGATA